KLEPEPLELDRRRLRLDLLRLFHQRTDDEDLLARLDPLPDEVVGELPLARLERTRPNRLASGRQLVNYRAVEVAVDGQGERPRDGRGGHHEQVRPVALRAEDGALLDTEAVLLVDDRQPEVGELDALLDQGVRADQEVDLAGRDRRRDLTPRRLRRASGQE